MALVTYDVSAKQVDVKSKMKEKGYHDAWTINKVTTYLPNTTLWKPGTTPAIALADIQDVAKKLSITLLRSPSSMPTRRGRPTAS